MLLTLDNRREITTQTIWRELNDRLRQFLFSRVASRADVDDILQQIFVKIHKKSGELQQVQRVESWVFQIARNAVADHFRTAQKANATLLQDVAAASDDWDGNLNREIAACMASLIARLPDDQRRAVSMYELQQLSQKEIASRESISLSGAKSRIQRGRAALAKILNECCQFELDRRGNVIDVAKLSDDSCESESCVCSKQTSVGRNRPLQN